MIIGVHDIKCGKHKKKDSNKEKIQTGKTIRKNEPIILKLLREIKQNKDNKEKKIKPEDKNATRVFDVDELKKNDEIYNSLQEKYDDRSKLNIRKIDIVDNYKIYITKEINISENAGLFEKDGLLAEEILEAIKNNELSAFSDTNLKIKITYEALKQRLIKPVILTNKRRKKTIQRFFKNTDMDNIEITGNIIWSKLLKDKKIDYLIVKISIPTSKSKLENDITVCYLNYDDFIDYITKRGIKAKTPSGIKINLSDAIINDKLNVMYTSISDYNTEYPITNNSFKENNFSAINLISELENKFYSYDAFL